MLYVSIVVLRFIFFQIPTILSVEFRHLHAHVSWKENFWLHKDSNNTANVFKSTAYDSSACIALHVLELLERDKYL